jgi:hypothetical protein
VLPSKAYSGNSATLMQANLLLRKLGIAPVVKGLAFFGYAVAFGTGASVVVSGRTAPHASSLQLPNWH